MLMLISPYESRSFGSLLVCVYTQSALILQKRLLALIRLGRVIMPFEVNNFPSQTDDDLIRDQYKINNISVEL